MSGLLGVATNSSSSSSGNIPGFYFCICPDAVLSKVHIDSFIATLPASWNSSNLKRKTFWGDDGDLDIAFWNTLNLQSFGDFFGKDGGSQLLYIRHAENLPAEMWARLSLELGKQHDGVLPVFFIESAWTKEDAKIPAHITKQKCFEFALEKKWEYRSFGLNERNIRDYLTNEIKHMSLTIEPQALNLLCQIIKPDAATVQNIVSQLSLFVENAHIDMNIANQVSSHIPDFMIFDFINHLQTGNVRKVWQILGTQVDGGESLLFPLIANLTRETRIMWQLLAGEPASIPPFIRSKKEAMAKQLGYTNLSKLFKCLLDADFVVKSGKLSPLFAFEELVNKCLHIYKNPVRNR